MGALQDRVAEDSGAEWAASGHRTSRADQADNPRRVGNHRRAVNRKANLKGNRPSSSLNNLRLQRS